jgi:hypothetical protein
MRKGLFSLVLFLVITALDAQQDLILYKLQHKPHEPAPETAEFRLSGFQTNLNMGGNQGFYSSSLLLHYEDPKSGQTISHFVSFGPRERFIGFTLGGSILKDNLIINCFNYTRGFNSDMSMHRIESGIGYLLKMNEHSLFTFRPGMDLVFANVNCNIYTQSDTIPRNISIENVEFNKITGEELQKRSFSLQPGLSITYDLKENVQLQAFCGYNYNLFDSERIKFESRDPKTHKGKEVFVNASKVICNQDGSPVKRKIVDMNSFNFRLGLAYVFRA